jgi:hypothetical protein
MLASTASAQQRPSKLQIDGPEGASVHVDGTFVGIAPLDEPVDVEPGKHSIAVTKNGYHAFAGEASATPGKTTITAAELDATEQRAWAWALVSAGGAGISTGIVFGVLSFLAHREARKLEGSDDPELSDSEQLALDDAIARRHDYRVASGIGAGIGFGVFLIGGALFVFDEPKLPALSPVISRDFTGGVLSLSF